MKVWVHFRRIKLHIYLIFGRLVLSLTGLSTCGLVKITFGIYQFVHVTIAVVILSVSASYNTDVIRKSYLNRQNVELFSDVLLLLLSEVILEY